MYRVKQDTKTGRYYPQRRILGIWFYYYNDYNSERYYTHSVEAALSHIEYVKHLRDHDRTRYDYSPDMKGFRVKNVCKKGSNKYYAQKRFMFMWFKFGSRNDHYSTGDAWNYIKRIDKENKTPKTIYHYPEKTRKEKIKSLKI